MWYAGLLDKGALPDPVIRFGIRNRLGAMLRGYREGGVTAQHERKRDLIERLRTSPIAIETEAANEQHYELPPAFFERCLGERLKYSCALWDTGARDLDAAEKAMLDVYIEHSRLADGMRLLDLGCGWGSLALYVGQRMPACEIVAVSNSAAQRRFIEDRAKARNITNLTVITEDANRFEPDGTFDRIISIEMLEHVKNYQSMFQRIASWMRDDALAFFHIFTHATIAYEFQPSGDWIGQHFFTGGNMPSDDLFLHFQDHLVCRDHWTVNGTNYQHTANAWLAKMDANKQAIMPAMREAYGDDAEMWFNRWRVFYLCCAELWGFAGGNEWLVSHYLFAKR